MNKYYNIILEAISHTHAIKIINNFRFWTKKRILNILSDCFILFVKVGDSQGSQDSSHCLRQDISQFCSFQMYGNDFILSSTNYQAGTKSSVRPSNYCASFSKHITFWYNYNFIEFFRQNSFSSRSAVFDLVRLYSYVSFLYTTG